MSAAAPAKQPRRGPAPRNMDIPVASFVDESTLKLG